MSTLVVGGGKMGLSHYSILSRIRNKGEVSICEPSFIARSVYRKLGINCFSSLQEALASPKKWDTAIIASPTPTHYPIALELARRRIPVFIEKPLTLNPKLNIELVRFQKQLGLYMQVGFVMRFMRPFVLLRKIIQEGQLGRPLCYRAKMLGNVVHAGTASGWRTDDSRGGGCLNEYGPHLLDLARYIFGDVRSINSVLFRKIHSARADDLVDIKFKHENGVEGDLHLSWCDTTQRKSFTGFEVEFTSGIAVVDGASFQFRPTRDSDDLKKVAVDCLGNHQSYQVSFYLRGEEFTLQLEAFLSSAIGWRGMQEPQLTDLAANISDGAVVDELIASIRNKAIEK